METRIAVVIVGVNDMHRAVAFYRDTLNLPLKFETPAYSEFSTAGAVLALELRDSVVANGPAFTLPTDNLDDDVRGLRQKGVRFWKDVRHESFGRLAMPYDSEGNIFEIVEYARGR